MHSSAQFHAERHTRTQGDTEASKKPVSKSLFMGFNNNNQKKKKLK